MSIGQRFLSLSSRIRDVAVAHGRNPSDVALVAVSKTVGRDEVAEAMSASAKDFGENRVDQLAIKAPFFPDARWHFIGNIQSRRIPEVVRHASLIHSLGQARHAELIADAARRLGKTQGVLVEVNVSGETSKGGCRPDDARGLVDAIVKMEGIEVCGLMTMAPRGDRHAARVCFDRLRLLRDDIRFHMDASAASCFTELSMGMSEDWEEAVAAGATLVRIGRAVFDDGFRDRFHAGQHSSEVGGSARACHSTNAGFCSG